MYDTRGVMRLYWPVLWEQALATVVTVLGTMLVGGMGEAVISGVGLVDTINFLLVNVMMSAATGITVVASQLMGMRKPAAAGEMATQSLKVMVYSSIIIMALMVIFSRRILLTLFGGAEPAVINAANTYFIATSISFPFLTVFSVVSGIMRAEGNNKTPLLGSLLTNIIYIAVAAACIRLFNLGVISVGIGLITARGAAAFMLIYILVKNPFTIKLAPFRTKINLKTILPMLRIAIPSAFDMLIFNGCKIIVQILMVDMGTAALAANAIANSLSNFQQLPARAFQIVIVTVVGHSFGAKDFRAARRNSHKLTLMAMLSTLPMSLGFYLALGPLINMFNPTPAAFEYTRQLMLLMIIVTPILWPASFVMPNALRAMNDVKFTMIVSIVSMIFLRLAGSWVLGVALGWGVFGIWLAMAMDWGLRGMLYYIRAIKYNPSAAFTINNTS